MSERSSPLDPFIPHPDVAERFGIDVRAPAALVLDVACGIDLQSLFLVRAIFRLRDRLMGSTPGAPRRPQGLLEELRGLGWGLLREETGRLVVGGAACQPWNADVVFRPIPAETFTAFAEPGQVKIAWTLEAVPLATALTRFRSETRAVATDAAARRQFRRYWRWARFGIVAIRLLLLPAVRREAERRYQRQERGHATRA
jgi:hypothetical protein